MITRANTRRFKAEICRYTDAGTGVTVRQVTTTSAIHHHPFFFVPAYDDASTWLFFVSHRHGRPDLFAEEQATGELVQLSQCDGLAEWSVFPTPDGRGVYYTAGTGCWRMDLRDYHSECLIDLADYRDAYGSVQPLVGTTALSRCGRWWAVRWNDEAGVGLAVIDTQRGTTTTILRRDVIAHMQFCPDDSDLLFYAGPLHDRVWAIQRDGTHNRRVYETQPGEWITHETWLAGTCEIAFVDWPHGMRAVHAITGMVRPLTRVNAWHAVANRNGTQMIADTNFPDIGLQLFDPRDGQGHPQVLCFPEATNQGSHWAGPFPYAHGPIPVYAPQHTHPHPSFSPDGRRVIFTSDRSGYAQVYEVVIPPHLLQEHD